MTGSTKQSMPATPKKEWIASSLSLLAMTEETASRSRRRFARALTLNFPPSEDQRARGMPGAQCTRSLVRAGGSKYAHEYSQRRHRKHPAFPTQWFYGLLRALPGDRALLPPSPATMRGIIADLAPASGRQDHASLPSALAPPVLRRRRVHRNPPHVRDDRETSLLARRDGDGFTTDLGFGKSEIFLRKGLDSEFAKRLVGQINSRTIVLSLGISIMFTSEGRLRRSQCIFHRHCEERQRRSRCAPIRR
jgi:hypothetical protein